MITPFQGYKSKIYNHVNFQIVNNKISYPREVEGRVIALRDSESVDVDKLNLVGKVTEAGGDHDLGVLAA